MIMSMAGRNGPLPPEKLELARLFIRLQTLESGWCGRMDANVWFAPLACRGRASLPRGLVGFASVEVHPAVPCNVAIFSLLPA